MITRNHFKCFVVFSCKHELWSVVTLEFIAVKLLFWAFLFSILAFKKEVTLLYGMSYITVDTEV